VRAHCGTRLKLEVPALSPCQPAIVEPAEPIARPLAGGVSGRHIQRHPPQSWGKEIRPATIAGIIILAFVLRLQPAAKHQSARDAARAAKRDEERVLIGAAVPGAGQALAGVSEA